MRDSFIVTKETKHKVIIALENLQGRGKNTEIARQAKMGNAQCQRTLASLVALRVVVHPRFGGRYYLNRILGMKHIYPRVTRKEEVFRVLLTFGGGAGYLRDISKAVGLKPAYVSKLLRSLVQDGVVSKPATGFYEIKVWGGAKEQ